MTIASPLSQISRSSVDAAARLTRITLDSAERMLAIQLEYAKGAVTQSTLTARAVSQVQDVEQLLSLRSQSEFSKLAEERLASYQNAVIEVVDQASRSAPGTGGATMAAVKSGMAATTAAFDSFNKAARQVASYADAGVKMAKPAKARK